MSSWEGFRDTRDGEGGVGRGPPKGPLELPLVTDDGLAPEFVAGGRFGGLWLLPSPSAATIVSSDEEHGSCWSDNGFFGASTEALGIKLRPSAVDPGPPMIYFGSPAVDVELHDIDLGEVLSASSEANDGGFVALSWDEANEELGRVDDFVVDLDADVTCM